MALFVKIALLSILIRIFAPYRSKIILIYALLAALCVYYTVAEIVKIRMCDPVPAYWNLSLRPTASCLDQQAALLADSVISVVTDLIILILPLPLTWALQMPRGKKLRVIGMLSAGGLATGFSIYRLVLVIRHGSSKDMTIVFTCVILSGYAFSHSSPSSQCRKKGKLTLSDKQQCRRRRGPNLRLPPNSKLLRAQTARRSRELRVRFETVLRAQRVGTCSAGESEECGCERRDGVWV